MSPKVRIRKRERVVPTKAKEPAPLSGKNWHIIEVNGELRPVRVPARLMRSIHAIREQFAPCLWLRSLRRSVRDLERAVGQRDPQAVVDATAEVTNLALLIAEVAPRV